jgi:hypothetical protein
VRLLKVLSVLIGIQILLISGCGSGGGSNGGSTPAPVLGASLATTIVGNSATCKLKLNNVSSVLCGFSAVITFPAGVTYNDNSIVTSGFAPATSSVTANPQSSTSLNIGFASGSTITSGEVATMTFTLGGAQPSPSNFIISSFTPSSSPLCQ